MSKEMVRFIRKLTGLTQDEFAKRLGYTPVYCSYLETGERNVSKQAKERIMTVFGISEADLMQYQEIMKKIVQ